MNRETILASLRSVNPSDQAAAVTIGLQAIRLGIDDPVIAVARAALAKNPSNSRLWQMLGLASRMAQDSRTALEAFSSAAVLNPQDALIAQSHAQAALEAGAAASSLFERACRLAPSNGSVLLGRAAARVAEGRVQPAFDELAALLRANPNWYDGHRAAARVAGQHLATGDPRQTVDTALKLLPGDPLLHQARVEIDLELRDYAAARRHIAQSLGLIRPTLWWQGRDAFCASELGDIALADTLFGAVGAPSDLDGALLRVRHEIRAGRIEPALALAEQWIDRDTQNALWPYLALGWRMTGNPRWNWLEGDPACIGVQDLADQLGDLDELADCLRSLHVFDHQPPDQSLRNGTQTDGNLLLRLDPPIAKLRSVVECAVEAHIAQLPPWQQGHPFLLKARAPVRFAGSWSVRLTQQGFHVDHIHSQGWLSSALYIALPAGQIGSGEGPQAHNGWLSLGECRDLVPGLAPVRLVEPKPGRLVLFPSTMWHGTRPFDAGERLTVAFDIARPAQI